MARGEISTKVVRRATKGGVLETEEFHTEAALDKVLRIHGAYETPETDEVKFLVLRDLEDVIPTEG